MRIPLNFNPLGFTFAPAPAGSMTRIAFLESDGAQAIDTEVVLTAPVYMLFTYQLLTDGGSSDYQYYFVADSNTTAAHRVLFGEAGAQNVWSWIGWNSGAGNLNLSNSTSYKMQKTVIDWSPEQITINGLSTTFTKYSNVSPSSANRGLCFFRRAGDPDGYTGGAPLRFWSFAFGFTAADEYIFTPVISAEGVPGMWEENQGIFYPNKGDGAFTAGIETLEQLTALAANLPTVTGTPEIKLSLPGAWNGDAAANEQLVAINSKGWQATISYRDTETAASSSYVWGGSGDGAASVVLWCKTVASESGNYQDENGNKYYIETCNDIWRSDGLSPDDLGYTAAADLASYLAENNLIPVDYSEEELTA